MHKLVYACAEQTLCQLSFGWLKRGSQSIWSCFLSKSTWSRKPRADRVDVYLRATDAWCRRVGQSNEAALGFNRIKTSTGARWRSRRGSWMWRTWIIDSLDPLKDIYKRLGLTEWISMQLAVFHQWGSRRLWKRTQDEAVLYQQLRHVFRKLRTITPN